MAWVALYFRESFPESSLFQKQRVPPLTIHRSVYRAVNQEVRELREPGANLIALQLDRLASGRLLVCEVLLALLHHRSRKLQFIVREVNFGKRTDDGLVEFFLADARWRTHGGILERAVVAAIIHVPLLPLGNERIAARGAPHDPAIREDMALRPVGSLASQGCLHLLEDIGRDQRFVIAGERLPSFADAHHADIERIREDGRKAVHADGSAIAVAQSAPEHFFGQLRKGKSA